MSKNKNLKKRKRKSLKNRLNRLKTNQKIEWDYSLVSYQRTHNAKVESQLQVQYVGARSQRSLFLHLHSRMKMLLKKTQRFRSMKWV